MKIRTVGIKAPEREMLERRGLLKLGLRVAKAVEERKAIPKISKGPKAEHLVMIELAERCGVFPFKGPEGQVDILVLKVKNNKIKFPIEAVGVEVVNFALSENSFHITDSKLRDESGPYYVVVVETDYGEYSYLVFTYNEMKQWASRKEPYTDGKRYFSVPRKNLEGNKDYEDYFKRWEKIPTCTGQA